MKTVPGKKLYSLAEAYFIFYNAFRTMPYMMRAEKRGAMTVHFRERLMMAVTEVNGCPMCTYAHTKWALEAGMDEKEVRNLLAGVAEGAPEDEIAGLLFAQHYADTRGHPSRETWDRIVELYGPAAAKGILGAVRAIMLGNVIGIAWGSFGNRFRGKPDKRSSLLYELAIILSTIPFFIAAALNAGVAALLRVPLIRFKREEAGQ